MAAVSAPLRKPGPPLEGESNAAARLSLVELLLTSDSARECAQATVDWLALKAGAKRAICALIDAESGKVLEGAAHGVPFLALPLPISEKREARLGLLLVAPARGALEREARWAAEYLGQKLSRLRREAALIEAEHKLGRERELLFNILNASPDPILLT